MRAFIVLCLVAVACADKLGYNYQPVAHSSSGLSFQPGSVGAPAVSSYAAPADSSFGAPATSSFGAPATSSFAAPVASSYLAPAGPSYSAPATSSNGASSHYAPATVEYEKEFYTFTGAEQQNDDSALRQQLESNLKKHLRVIFIKNPEDSGLEKAALSLAKHATEQKTAIYVLHKQADLSDLANKLNSVSNHNSLKPEVHFVKYRTQEDAANAQHAIQAQYDQLGGSSHSHSGGVAPVLNFASSTDVVHGADSQSPQAAYLPASVFRS